MREVVIQLNNRSISSPTKKRWVINSVRSVLKRETYTGRRNIGGEAKGKYNKATEAVTIEDAHPAIIDRETWRQSQAMFNGKKLGAHTRNGNEGTPLGGLVRCGGCGEIMHARKQGKRHRYICSRYVARGDCRCHVIDVATVLSAVAETIRQKMLMGSRDALEAEIRRLLAGGIEASEAEAKARGVKLAALDKKISRASKRLATVDNSLVGDVQEVLLSMKAEREQLAAAAEQQAMDLDPAAIADGLWELDEIMQNGSPSIIRRHLSTMIESVTLDFEECGGGAIRKRYRCIGGTISFEKVRNSNVLV